SPVFLVAAMRDPSDLTSPLQHLQIIKGWISEGGEAHYRVFEAAGDPNNGATVDESTCARNGNGFSTLCATWKDPEFNAKEPAFYYARVIENPSCRWSTELCNSLPQSKRPRGCGDSRVPRVIQEMAWTSAIWYTP